MKTEVVHAHARIEQRRAAKFSLSTRNNYTLKSIGVAIKDADFLTAQWQKDDAQRYAAIRKLLGIEE